MHSSSNARTALACTAAAKREWHSSSDAGAAWQQRGELPRLYFGHTSDILRLYFGYTSDILWRQVADRGQQAEPMGHRPETSTEQSAARGQQAKGGGQRVQAGRVQSIMMRQAAEGRGQRAVGKRQRVVEWARKKLGMCCAKPTRTLH